MMDKQQMIDMVCAVQQGDEGAATALYDSFHSEIFNYIMNTVNDAELAADLTQNTFMEIFVTIRKLEEPAAFLNWSKRIAYHRCTAYFRKRRELLADEINDSSILDALQEGRKEFIPGEMLDENELKAAVRTMINDLPTEQRSAILLRYFEELSVKEIAQIQGVSEGTIKSRLNYGRKSLKKAVEKYERKHNIKLHCAGVIPLLLWLFREFKVSKGLSLTVRVACETFTAAAEGQSAAVLVGASSASAGTAVTAKVIAGVTAVAVTVSGITATVIPIIKRAGPDIRPETTISNQANELSYVLSGDGTYYEVRGIGTVAGLDIIIPAEYNGLPVKTIGVYAFANCENITSVSLPDSITHINEQAFSGCTSLASITIPGGLKEIAPGAFYGCTALSDVTISEGVTSIGDAAFWGCNSLKKINLPESLIQIGSGAFCDCTGLTALSLPANVSVIEEFAFTGCTGLEWITVNADNPVYHSSGNCLIATESKALILGCKNSVIPTDGSVVEIAAAAFSECTMLSNITLPASITVIRSTAFYNCGNLTAIHYSGTMDQWDLVAHGLGTDGIGDYTVHCTDGKINQGIHHAIVPESYQGLIFYLSDDGSYYRVKHATNEVSQVTVPSVYNGLPVCEVNFSFCEGLTSITIPDGVTAISTDAFAFCGSLTNVTLPNTLTDIFEYAFSNCASLRAITIPASVRFLGDKAFGDCRRLTDIYYPGSMEQWNEIEKADSWDLRTGSYTVHCTDGDILKELPPVTEPEGSVGLAYILNEDGVSYMVTGMGSCTDTNVIIPSKYNGLSVTSIEEEAFYGNTKITGVTIPASVVSIEEHCFGENPNLEMLKVEAGNTVYHSAGNCIIETEMKTVIIGCKASVIPVDGSVTCIGDYAFYSSGLTNIVVPETVRSIGHMAFANNFDMISITLPGELTAISDVMLSYCSELTEIYFLGTMEQWNALEKGAHWNYETGSYTVHCSDGDVAKT